MLRRTLAPLFASAILVALVLPGSALALRVHVRVEGATKTIFGATEPYVTPFTGTLDAGDGATVELEQPTALGALEAASAAGEFFYRLIGSSFGPYVGQIGRTPGSGASGWVFKVNGVSPPVGADAYVVRDGDTVLWYYATFAAAGGPLTLDLARSGACLRAYEVNDAGERAKAEDVVFLLDGRSVESASGRLCPTGHWHSVRATKDGGVRSEVLRPG